MPIKTGCEFTKMAAAGAMERNILPWGAAVAELRWRSLQQPIWGTRIWGEWRRGMGKLLRYVGPCWCHGGPGTGCGPCCQRTCGHDPHPYAGSGSRTCWGGRRSDEQYRWTSALFKTEIHPLRTAVAHMHFLTHTCMHNWHIPHATPAYPCGVIWWFSTNTAAT